MGEALRAVTADGGQYVREFFDKNSASDYLSERLGEEISSHSMRMYHHREKCVASGRFEDGRLRWTRADLDRFIKKERAISALKTSSNLAYNPL
jgi:hypothetical protein